MVINLLAVLIIRYDLYHTYNRFQFNIIKWLLSYSVTIKCLWLITILLYGALEWLLLVRVLY